MRAASSSQREDGIEALCASRLFWIPAWRWNDACHGLITVSGRGADFAADPRDQLAHPLVRGMLVVAAMPVHAPVEALVPDRQGPQLELTARVEETRHAP